MQELTRNIYISCVHFFVHLAFLCSLLAVPSFILCAVCIFFSINIFFVRYVVRLSPFFPYFCTCLAHSCCFLFSLSLPRSFSFLSYLFFSLPHMYRSYDVLYFRFAMYILNRAINFNISMLSWSLLVFRCALWIFKNFICAACF